jgi:hypothetical protein
MRVNLYFLQRLIDRRKFYPKNIFIFPHPNTVHFEDDNIRILSDITPEISRDVSMEKTNTLMIIILSVMLFDSYRFLRNCLNGFTKFYSRNA